MITKLIENFNQKNKMVKYPEKFFMKVIKNEFFDKNYMREYPFKKYSLDFAWVHKKKVIEIDGEQHEQFEEYKNRDKLKRTYYFLSQTDAAYLNLVPKIPDNEFVDWGAEDNTTKRVCLAPTINKCILAIGRLKPNQELTVYSIELSDSDLIHPTKQQVPDVHITNEVWVTHPIQVVRRMKIRIKDSYKKEYELTFKKADGTTYIGHPREYEYQISEEERLLMECDVSSYTINEIIPQFSKEEVGYEAGKYIFR